MYMHGGEGAAEQPMWLRYPYMNLLCRFRAYFVYCPFLLVEG